MMIQSNRFRIRSRPLLFILLTLITLLSGCSHLSPTFDPERAIFFNPVTNEDNTIYGVNLNTSGQSFRHLDHIELIVGLKDLEGNPGVTYSLSLSIVYTPPPWVTRQQTSNLSELLNIYFVTNQSGIAKTSFIYNQYTWPKNSYTTEGFFNISCSKLDNCTVISDTYSFRYYHSEVYRNSTNVEGLQAIQSIEMMNLLEEALNLGGVNNSYEEIIFTRPDLLYLIINASVINGFGSQMSASRIEFIYQAWGIELELQNLSYSGLNAIWDDYMSVMLPKSLLTDDWFSSGDLSQINFTEGWIVFQSLYYYSFAGVLNTAWWDIYQLAILTTDFQLLWLTSYLYHAYT